MRTRHWLVVFLILVTLSYCHCDKLNVHLIPHTHNDVGWLKTVDEYYYGGNQSIQDAGVQYILDTVMTELEKNPDRKFIYVEMAFFHRWWNEQTEDMKNKVRGFVKNGQLEFINGGWCMNDEATTHYNAIIDQMTLGLNFIKNNFGPEARPTIGWHIDPFGHSNEQASLFSLMGFNGFFLGRIDYDDKRLRLNTTTLEMMWRGSPSLNEMSDIFTGVLYNQYRPPKGFCFDQGCRDEPIKDDPKLYGYNVHQRVDSFIKAAFDQAKYYKTNNILMTMGEDFQYSNALMWFKNLDKLIKYVNQNGSINVMYSTPSIYLEYLNKADKTWTLKTDDFFPYADKPYAFWTGYFTSRPALKGYVRKCNNRLQVCKQLEAIVNGLPNGQPSSLLFKMAVGVAQHHDAVAGTEKQHVADDYAKRLHIGEAECNEVVAAALNSLVSKDKDKMDFHFCEYLNISACPSSESGNFNLLVYNPLGRAYQWYLRFPVNTPAVTVTGPTGKDMSVEVLTVSNCTKSVRGKLSNASYEAVVSMHNSSVPPLGFAMFTVRAKSSRHTHLAFPRQLFVKKYPMEDIVISNDYYQVVFSGSTGHISKITNKITGISANVDQQFLWYNSSAGNNKNSTQCSGAYIFRPNSSELFHVNQNSNHAKIVTFHKGTLVQEVEQEFAPWINQVVRLYDKFPAIEIQFTVGPIPYKDRLGKEVISRFDTDLHSDSIFYTDANGRQMQKRKRNFRPTWKYNNTVPIGGDYYPVNSRIFIRDEPTGKRQFTVMTDRTQGGSSSQDGSLELMLHRRLFHDDRRGVGEPLNETGQFGDGLIIRGKQYVILDNLTSSTYLHRMLGEALMLEPELVFAESNGNMKQFNQQLIYSFIQSELPPEIHLLTLELLEPNVYLLRLEHQFESNDSVYNTNVTVSLSELFAKVKVSKVLELSLAGNAALSDINKYKWKINSKASHGSSVSNQHLPVTAPEFTVQLSPMEIRTFNITITMLS